jgi:hypothetical protein
MLKRGNVHKTMRVTPNVTDPSMQNGKSQPDILLMPESDDNPDIEDTVFHSKTRTREEQQSQHTSSDNTILMIIFALIVIALVAIIVWIIMKQGNDKKEEEEIKRRIMPHQRNNMPMMQQYARHQDPRYSDPRYGMHMQRRQQPAQMGEPEEQVDDEEAPAKSLSEALTKKSKNAAKSEKEKNADMYDKKHPHPSILRPGGSEDAADAADEDVEAEEVEEVEEEKKVVPKASRAAQSRKNKTTPKQSIVDDVMQKTAELLDTDTELTEEDKALLDKAEEEANDDDE